MNRMILAAGLAACALAVPAQAQEHFTEGPVWAVSYYRIQPDKGADYLKWLRANYLPTAEAEKKQGLILDYKVFFNSTRRDEKDWDIAFASLFPSYGKALDYSAEDEMKGKAISASQYKTKDEAKQQEIVAPRLSLRTYIGTSYFREVSLKPSP